MAILACLRLGPLAGACAFSLAALAAEGEVTVQGRVTALAFQLEVPAPADRVLEALFDVRNLALLSRADRVEVLVQEPDRQVVRYTYRTMFLENRSVYERVRVPGAGLLRMVLVENVRSSRLLPQQEAASGFYRVTPGVGGSRVEYRQETRFSRDLGALERRYLAGSGESQLARMKAFLLDLR